MADQDDCLIAIEDGRPLAVKNLLALPPWRAVLMGRVAAKSRIGLEMGTLEQLIAEAREVGGAGRLGNWWEGPQVIIAVQNLSTLISSRDSYDMTLLVNRQLRDHVAPAWGLLPPSVTFLPQGGAGARYGAIIGILDDADQAGDLGWHAEGPDADVYGRVFARPVLSNGGNALTADLSVCSVLSHEAIEVLGDPACDLWAQRADGLLIARELCDPVESDSYRMTITAQGGEQVTGTVSDFALPAWFDPTPPRGRQTTWAWCPCRSGCGRRDTRSRCPPGRCAPCGDRSTRSWRKETKQSQLARSAQRVRIPVPLVFAAPTGATLRG